CAVCHLKEPIEYKDYGDGLYCISKRTCHVVKHSYQNGKCTRCGFEHVKHKYQYTSLDGKDNCTVCGKEVSHKWVSNKNGKCVCQNCGHEEPHSYKTFFGILKKCRRCGAIDRDIKTTPTQPKKYYE
ncbi:MAG: hypothetical protein PUB25_05555, partial [Lachnospiraceae bacterium]|nr:hypothetical protein [Lachnospiraceae bacterium]